MNRTIPTLITAGALALTLTACGTETSDAIGIEATTAAATSTAVPVDGFMDEETKQRAWDAYQCIEFVKQLPEVTSFKINVDLQLEDIPASQIPEAESALERLSEVTSTGGAVDRTYGDHMCTGWLWEWNKGRYNYHDGYHRFTFDDAKAAGLVAQ